MTGQQSARRRAELVWTVLVAGLLSVGLLQSEGEPVCEGPLIRGTNDSFPPECASPLEAVPIVLALWVLGLVVIGVARAVAATIRTSRARRSAAS